MPTTTTEVRPRDVLPPQSVLRRLAAPWEEWTDGILKGDVEHDVSEGKATDSLVVVAPLLGGYRYVLLRARHVLGVPYPVEVLAARLSAPRPATAEELVRLARRAFESPETKSTIRSLIARSREVLAAGRSHHPRSPLLPPT